MDTPHVDVRPSSSVACDDSVNYFAVPSLESAVYVRIVTELFKHPDVREKMKQRCPRHGHIGLCHFAKRKQCSIAIIELLTQKITAFLPVHLVTGAFRFIRPIGLQLSNCLENKLDGLRFLPTSDLVNNICWTPCGRIDMQRTLDSMISEELITDHGRDVFEAACNFCMETRIPFLWAKLPENERESSFYTRDVYEKSSYHFIAYWTCWMNEDFSGFLDKVKQYDDHSIYDCSRSIPENMFALSLAESNLLGMQYFWCRLTDKEISDNLLKWVNLVMDVPEVAEWIYLYTGENADILFFLLSKLTREQQVRVFRNHYNFILMTAFSCHPWQRYLLPTLEIVWDFIDCRQYIRFMSLVISEIKVLKFAECVLKDLWTNSPMSLKKCYLKHIENSAGYTILKLLKVNDKHALRMLLADASPEQKRRIMFSTIPDYGVFIYKLGLDCAKALMKETLTSDSDIEHFKREVVRRHTGSLCTRWLCKDDNWEAIEDFLKWAHDSSDVISNFKKIQFHKYCTARSLIRMGKYESLEKFMKWYFPSPDEIVIFKKRLAYTRSFDIVRQLGTGDWRSFENFISWWSEENEACISQFKHRISEFGIITSIIHDTALISQRWEFAAEFLRWCFNCVETIQKFKEKVLLVKGRPEYLFRIPYNENQWKTFEKICEEAAARSDYQTESSISSKMGEECISQLAGPRNSCDYEDFM